MEEVLAFIVSVFEFLKANYALYVVVIMGILMTIIYCVLSIVKKPIKKLTDKIKSTQLRHLANKSIIVLSFAFSTLFWFALHYFVPQYFGFNGVEILLTGAFPVVLYAFVENLNKPEMKDIKGKMQEIMSDNKVDTKEAIQVAKNLSSMIEQKPAKKDAEKELNKLLKK